MSNSTFDFTSHKTHIHRWPLDTPEWSQARKQEIDDFNKNKVPRKVSVDGKTLQIATYKFDSIKKIGITIPLFKRQSTVIFEGRCDEFDAHVHITTKSEDYLETFNNLMNWRKSQFPDAYYID